MPAIVADQILYDGKFPMFVDTRLTIGQSNKSLETLRRPSMYMFVCADQCLKMRRSKVNLV